VTRKEKLELLISNKGRVFTVIFIKKDGSIRKMNCRIGVTNYLKGGSLKFDPTKRGLLSVFDMQKKSYRFINLDTIQSITMKGKRYNV